jgi:hypothetical protein
VLAATLVAGPLTAPRETAAEVRDLIPFDLIGDLITSALPPELARTGFIDHLFQQVLGRNADLGSLARWSDFLRRNCNAEGAADTVRAFLDSPEFRARALALPEMVSVLYETILDRSPDPGGLDAWVARLRQTRLAVALDGFIRSSEFQSLLSDRSDPEAVRAVVLRLYSEVLQREPDAGEVDAWVDFIVSTHDLDAAAAAFLTSPEFESLPQTFKDFVTTLYRTFLGREPEPAGLQGWEGLLRAAWRDVIDGGFIPSTEFRGILRQICG